MLVINGRNSNSILKLIFHSIVSMTLTNSILSFSIIQQGHHSKFELTGAKNWWLVANEDKVSKSSEKVHSKTKMAEN